MRGFRINICLFAIFCLVSCGGGRTNVTDSGISGGDSAGNAAAATQDITSQVMDRVDSVMATMTLEQIVGQCFMPAIYSSDDVSTMRKLRSYISDLHVGGIVLLKGDLTSAAVMSGAGSAAEVPLFIAIDAEWGLGMRLSDAPDFPRNGKLGAGADESLLFDYGVEVARECRRVGINMVLGPVVDVTENPGGVIGNRSFGGDPRRVADLGVAYARGLESGRVVSVAKHFPGHGSPQGDSHRSLPVIKRSLHQLDSIDLYPFRSYIDAGLSGVMVGHLAVPAIDPLCLPAAVSSVVIGDLLRTELGFKGLVLTDALNMGGVEGHGASAALAAGADIVVAPSNTADEIRRVLESVEFGDMDIKILQDRCRRILFYKFLAGVFEPKSMNLERLREDVGSGTDSLYDRLVR
ncbi:MAG: hypothetical protein K2I44_02120 [Muribaculaceae bacterium]|nr:hypothetical protein [Muribaculaceae bacterium]